MNWKTSKVLLFILTGIIFLSHLPFIQSDPDRNMAVGRGPFTDEGLNTIQVRNWINQGDLDLSACDNLLKTPLFGFPLALTYKVFGTSHAVSRLHVLILLLSGVLAIGLDQKHRLIIIIFSLITLLQYQAFHSSHFSMAEMLSVAAILLSIHFLARSFDMDFNQHRRTGQAILSAVFLSLSYYIKIQFIYLVFLIPLVLFIRWFTTNFFIRKVIVRQGFAMTATLLFFLLLYLLAWYLPNKDTYDLMMAHQSGGFAFSHKTWEYIRFNLDYHFLKGWLQWFIYIFLILLISGFVLLRRSKSRRYPVLFFSSLAWFLLELHKMAMVYLPTRYQVSMLVSMGLLMSVVLAELMDWPIRRTRNLARMLAVTMIFIMIAINGYNYFDTLHNRTYAIRDTNRYLSLRLSEKDLVLGAWAPSLTWDCKSKALPVWNDFLNYKDPLTTFNPAVIIAETDEQDSEKAWSGQGINLKEISDSSNFVKIGQWEVGIYFLHHPH